MDNSISIIHQTELLGKSFQIYGTKNAPLFLAKDVAEWIEHSNCRMMLQSVDDDEKVQQNRKLPKMPSLPKNADFRMPC